MINLSLSIDDGCASDVRVAELAEKYEISTVFYWPVEWHSLAYDKGYLPLTFDEAWEIASKHEIGSHTITHRHLTSLSIDEATEEIRDSQTILERIFRQPIDKFCPPRGYTNTLLNSIILKNYKELRLTKGGNLVHIHPDSGANGNIDWRKRFGVLKDSGIKSVELWGHSWEWDKFNLWEDIEEFFSENLHS